MKILSIVGARPQFIKAAPLSRKLRESCREVLVHTGQHYDDNMSAAFFKELSIPAPDYHLGIGSGRHGMQTGAMLTRIEELLLNERPDWVLVYGDTNSTLAGALAACKLPIPLAHVEAGLRSFNRKMPEESNRILTDHCSDLLFCPSQAAVDNLGREGLTEGVHLVGDIMFDAVLQFSEIANQCSTILQSLNVRPREYLLATVHRPGNTDVAPNLRNILDAFLGINEPILFPIHPRTRKRIAEFENMPDLQNPTGKVKLIEPVGYMDMLILERNARLILTDSGGMQKEAYWLGVPCVTLREETEWVETVEAGWNTLVGADPGLIVEATRSFNPPSKRRPLYGDGNAAAKCASILAQAAARS